MIVSIVKLSASILAGAIALGAAAEAPVWNGFRAPVRTVKENVRGCLWLEAEHFADYGGWKIDTQYVGHMGSAYLIAPGVTGAVAAASTALDVPSAGRWRAWVRTRDWLPEFSPGVFALEIGGRSSPPLGNSAKPGWRWQNAGEFELQPGRTTVRLVDRSGWFSRCDAILLTTDLSLTPPDDPEPCEALRVRCQGLKPEADGGDYDTIVVGAGPAGSAAAIAAARAGARTLLVTDRPVVGGNASSEFRLTTFGPYMAHPEYVTRGIDGEMRALLAKGMDGTAAYSALMRAETNLTVVLNRRVIGAVTDKATRRIRAVRAVDTLNGSRHRWTAKTFVDATGDGWLGYYAGAKYMFGSEGRDDYGEKFAPAKSNACTMAGTLMSGLGLSSGLWWGFRRETTAAPVKFVPPPWILPLPENFKPSSMLGLDGGMIEHPHALDDVADPEAVRDYLIRMSVTYWDWLKNRSPRRGEVVNDRLAAIPWTVGRREGRRLVGEYVLTENDLLAGRKFPDAIGQGGYAVTTHNPEGSFAADPSYPRPQPPLYDIPLRSLHSINVPNLWMCGRCASMTHRALGSMRVQSTCAVTGEAAGRAAAEKGLSGKAAANCGSVKILGKGAGAASAKAFLEKHGVPIGAGPLKAIFGDAVDDLDDAALTNRLWHGGIVIDAAAAERIGRRGFAKLVQPDAFDPMVPDRRIQRRQAKGGWTILVTDGECRADVLLPHLELAAATSLRPLATERTKAEDAKLPPALCPKPQHVGEFSWWQQCFLYKRGEAAWVKDRAKTVFCGDSITQLFAGEAWEENFGSGRDLAVNCGICGDRTENLIYRLRNGALDYFEPETAVLLIGVNNLSARPEEPPEMTAAAIKECLRLIRLRNPQMKIILNAIFPWGRRPDDPRRERVRKVNAILRTFADGESVKWLDMIEDFLAADGTLPKELFPDELHPSQSGYRLWARRLKAMLE